MVFIYVIQSAFQYILFSYCPMSADLLGEYLVVHNIFSSSVSMSLMSESLASSEKFA